MSMKVLVADDDRSMRDLVVCLLNTIGISEVVEACDGEEAFDLFERDKFDLAVLDWEMPGRSGVEVIRAIRAAGSRVPIIMVTVRAEREQLREAIQAGASDFLAKPFDADVLRDKLRRLCQNIEALKQLKQRTGASMNVEYINPFVTSVISLFDTMLGVKLTRGQPFVKSGMLPEHDVSGIIGLTGKAKGVVVLSLGRQSALSATEVMLQERPDEIDADVVDAVGELANIVAGGAKAQLEQLALSVSLPTVITGKDHCIEFPSDVTPVCIPFHCEWGTVTVEVGLIEQPAEARAAAAFPL